MGKIVDHFSSLDLLLRRLQALQMARHERRRYVAVLITTQDETPKTHVGDLAYLRSWT